MCTSHEKKRELKYEIGNLASYTNQTLNGIQSQIKIPIFGNSRGYSDIWTFEANINKM